METFKLEDKHKKGITLTFDGVIHLVEWLLDNKELSKKDRTFCLECLSARSFNRKQKIKAVRLLTKYTNVRLQDTAIQLPAISL